MTMILLEKGSCQPLHWPPDFLFFEKHFTEVSDEWGEQVSLLKNTDALVITLKNVLFLTKCWGCKKNKLKAYRLKNKTTPGLLG